jgi:hypothetical protein
MNNEIKTWRDAADKARADYTCQSLAEHIAEPLIERLLETSAISVGARDLLETHPKDVIVNQLSETLSDSEAASFGLIQHIDVLFSNGAIDVNSELEWCLDYYASLSKQVAVDDWKFSERDGNANEYVGSIISRYVDDEIWKDLDLDTLMDAPQIVINPTPRI